MNNKTHKTLISLSNKKKSTNAYKHIISKLTHQIIYEKNTYNEPIKNNNKSKIFNIITNICNQDTVFTEKVSKIIKYIQQNSHNIKKIILCTQKQKTNIIVICNKKIYISPKALFNVSETIESIKIMNNTSEWKTKVNQSISTKIGEIKNIKHTGSFNIVS